MLGASIDRGKLMSQDRQGDQGRGSRPKRELFVPPDQASWTPPLHNEYAAGVEAGHDHETVLGMMKRGELTGQQPQQPIEQSQAPKQEQRKSLEKFSDCQSLHDVYQVLDTRKKAGQVLTIDDQGTFLTMKQLAGLIDQAIERVRSVQDRTFREGGAAKLPTAEQIDNNLQTVGFQIEADPDRPDSASGMIGITSRNELRPTLVKLFTQRPEVVQVDQGLRQWQDSLQDRGMYHPVVIKIAESSRRLAPQDFLDIIEEQHVLERLQAGENGTGPDEIKAVRFLIQEAQRKAARRGFE